LPEGLHILEELDGLYQGIATEFSSDSLTHALLRIQEISLQPLWTSTVFDHAVLYKLTHFSSQKMVNGDFCSFAQLNSSKCFVVQIASSAHELGWKGWFFT